MGKGNMVRPVCTGQHRTSESSQHSKAREKSFYTKSRLERGEVCLPVKTFMLHDRMKMAIPHRKYVKTLQDSHSGIFCLFFFFFGYSHIQNLEREADTMAREDWEWR